MNLTDHEKEVILDISRRMGCDRDGDAIKFIVNERANDVIVIRLNKDVHLN